MTCIYNETDILKIKDNGFDITLPQEALDMIQHISDQVGSPSYVRTPTFAKSSRNKKPTTTIPYTGSSFTKVDVCPPRAAGGLPSTNGATKRKAGSSIKSCSTFLLSFGLYPTPVSVMMAK